MPYGPGNVICRAAGARGCSRTARHVPSGAIHGNAIHSISISGGRFVICPHYAVTDKTIIQIEYLLHEQEATTIPDLPCHPDRGSVTGKTCLNNNASDRVEGSLSGVGGNELLPHGKSFCVQRSFDSLRSLRMTSLVVGSVLFSVWPFVCRC